MKSVQQFNNLNGKNATRNQLIELQNLAITEKQYHLSKGIGLALAVPGDEFKIDLPELVAVVTTKDKGLNASRHKGFGKIGLDCSGRLLPGYLFDGYGNVVPSLNPNPKTRKNKKRLSDTCQDDCKPCNDPGAKIKNIATKKATKKQIRVTPKVTIKKDIPTPFDKEIETLKKEVKTVSGSDAEIVVKKINKLYSARKRFDANQINDINNVEVSRIFTDEKRFQNRTKLDQRIVNNIVDNFDVAQFDPIVLWVDTKQNNKLFVLAGHHRFEAIKQLNHKTIQAKIAEYTEKEAIEYAKVKSNANRTLEQPQERAKIYREMRMSGKTKTNIQEFAKAIEGKNATYIIALSYCDANGAVINALKQMADTTDKENETLLSKIALWIGEARKNNSDLTKAHEIEMFAFLMNKDASKTFTTKTIFLHKISSIAGDMYWKPSDVLNLNRFKYKTQGESIYEAEYKELQNKIEATIANKQNLIDRIKNPLHPDFIKPTEKDYTAVTKAMEVAITKYNTEISFLQKKIIELAQKKGTYTNASSNQVGLFGINNTIKLSNYTIANNCTDITDAKNGFNEVYDAIAKYKKLGKKVPAFWYLRSSKLVDKIKYFENLGLNVTAQHLETIKFNKSILLAKRSGIDTEKVFNIGKTKDVLLEYFGSEKIILLGSVIHKAMNKDKAHCVRWDHLINLPDNINNPLAIFKSKYNGFVVLTEIIDELNKPLMVAIQFNKTFEVKDIKSIYSKTNDNTYRDWKENGLLLYENKKSKIFARVLGLIPRSANKMPSENKYNKNNTKNTNGLNFAKKIAEVNTKSTVTATNNNIDLVQQKKTIPAAINKNSIAYRKAQSKNQIREYYKIDDPEIARFLGKIEKKKKESVAITVAGGEGSMKTRFCFQLINAFGQNYKVGHASIEEHPESSLYEQKVDQYLNSKAQNNVENPEINSISDVTRLIQNNDIIVIDSFTKLQEMQKGIELDKDFRKKYDGKLFIIIYQLTTGKTMRGGSKSQFDGDIITVVEKFDDYTKNYIQATKNRYNDTPASQLKFNIFSGKMVSLLNKNNVQLKFK